MSLFSRIAQRGGRQAEAKPDSSRQVTTILEEFIRKQKDRFTGGS